MMELCGRLDELLVCSSFSKNFGLYNERVGALTLVGPTPQATAAALSHAKMCVRTDYSNPPFHGGDHPDRPVRSLAASPVGSRTAADARPHQSHADVVCGDHESRAPRDFSFITQQCGMFSFSGLSRSTCRRSARPIRHLHRQQRPDQRRRDDGRQHGTQSVMRSSPCCGPNVLGNPRSVGPCWSSRFSVCGGLCPPQSSAKA